MTKNIDELKSAVEKPDKPVQIEDMEIDYGVENANAALYQSYRAEIDARHQYNSHARDTSILVLSCVFLALSITLPNPNTSDFLTTAHVLFCVAIILTMISFTIGHVSLDTALENAEAYYLRNGNYTDRRVLGSVSRALNYFVTPTVFILAIICLVAFSLVR